ncbi:unnamed protein product, partial [Iphiclides podalirius]
MQVASHMSPRPPSRGDRSFIIAPVVLINGRTTVQDKLLGTAGPITRHTSGARVREVTDPTADIANSRGNKGMQGSSCDWIRDWQTVRPTPQARSACPLDCSQLSAISVNSPPLPRFPSTAFTSHRYSRRHKRYRYIV